VLLNSLFKVTLPVTTGSSDQHAVGDVVVTARIVSRVPSPSVTAPKVASL
jgi:hypothetical protein